MKFATTFAAIMIGGLLPLAAASEVASAKVFDWSLTGTLPSPGGFRSQEAGRSTHQPTASTGAWSIDAITASSMAARSPERARSKAPITCFSPTGLRSPAPWASRLRPPLAEHQYFQLRWPNDAADRQRLWRAELKSQRISRRAFHPHAGP